MEEIPEPKRNETQNISKSFEIAFVEKLNELMQPIEEYKNSEEKLRNLFNDVYNSYVNELKKAMKESFDGEEIRINIRSSVNPENTIYEDYIIKCATNLFEYNMKSKKYKVERETDWPNDLFIVSVS